MRNIVQQLFPVWIKAYGHFKFKENPFFRFLFLSLSQTHTHSILYIGNLKENAHTY